MKAGLMVACVFTLVLLPGVIQKNTALVKSTYAQKELASVKIEEPKEDVENKFFEERDTRVSIRLMQEVF